MKARIFTSVILSAVLLLGLCAACKPAASKKMTITAADDGWDSQKFHNAIAKLVIEHAYDGYELKFSTASATMNWESLKKGDVDIYIEQWIDTCPTYYDDIKSGDIIRVGVIVEDSKQGIYVPRYVIEGDKTRGIAPVAPDLKKVEDLVKYAKAFPDEENPNWGGFYGSIPGWMTDVVLYKKFQYLGLDKTYKYIRLGSEAALFMSLYSAYNLGKPWVGYCYEPTWIVGKLDLIKLEDVPFEQEAFLEGKTDFSAQELLNICSRQFPAKAPEILEFLKKYRTGSKILSEALAYLDETKATHDAAAVWFLKKHDDLLDQWLPPANAKKLRDYLSKQK